MSISLRVVFSELADTRRKPERFLSLFSAKRWRSFLHYQRLGLKIGQRWDETEGSGTMVRRSYSSYEEYLELQKSKLERLDLSKNDVKFRETLGARLQKLEFIKPGMTVLCLAARIGTEVKAFDDANCFTVGIDLNP